MVIFPAIDLLDGAVVRLHQGAYDQVTGYELDPLDQAKAFVDSGAEWVHVVDLNAARTGETRNLHLIEAIARQSGARLQVGGGVRSLEAAERLGRAGVSRIVAGSALVNDPDFAVAFFEGDRDWVPVAGIDTKDFRVAIHGWEEVSPLTGLDLARQMAAIGCREAVFTDVARDGTLQGPNLEALRAMVVDSGLSIVASGGVGTLEDLLQIRDAEASGVIVGKALYEGRFALEDALALVK